MKIIYSILFLFLTAASFSAEGGICIPCDACWIQSVGGPVLEPGSVGDMVSRGISEGQKQYNHYKQQATALVNKTISTLQDGASAVFKEARETAKETAVDLLGEQK
ncbi:MAG: hypothetical protein J6V53_03945 [Alphaproteobacteria bacterium]|nr:hypothetical protein [Alphaproteobacteria bacterium]